MEHHAFNLVAVIFKNQAIGLTTEILFFQGKGEKFEITLFLRIKGPGVGYAKGRY